MNPSEQQQLSKELFGDTFQWGVASAAFQIEGSPEADGKGLSIWDTFTRKKGKIHFGHHARLACDFYNRYESDIRLVEELNIPNFRFSIAWPRILPTGHSKVWRSLP